MSMMLVRPLGLLLAFSILGGTLCAQTPATDTGREVRWKMLPGNLLSDQKHIWLYPTQVVRGRHLWPTLAVVAVTAALIATDAQTAPHFRNTTAFNRFNSVFNSRGTDMGVLAAPVLLYAGGFFGRNSYARHTAILAGEAVGDSEILAVIAKDIDRRSRPSSYAPGASMSDSWFNATGSGLRSTGSFPSGHTIAAFSVATVIARRYPNQRWVPYVAYGLAAVVGFSRLTLSAHFPSDVFVGGALGYSISRFAVLQQ